MKQALIIGAGIHGATIAIELAKDNYEVTVVDSNPDILMGTSGGSHNRIHLGHHYPRSEETVFECKKGHEYFKKHFGDSMGYPDFYYVVEKNDSRVSAQEYRDFMDKVGLEYKEEWPENIFLNKENIEFSFKVREAYFDILKLREIIKERFGRYNIKVCHNFMLQKVEISRNNTLKLMSNSGQILEIKPDLIINATYTYTNNVQRAFGLVDHLTEYEFENTEVAVVGCDYEIPALTVIDGPFITIMPYGGHEGKYLVYDVVNSVVSRSYGVEYDPNQKRESNWQLMLARGLKYYPFFKDLKYSHSLWANRPIPLRKEAQFNDSRATRIVKHNYPINFYSILEGKIVSAPMVAEELADVIRKDNND